MYNANILLTACNKEREIYITVNERTAGNQTTVLLKTTLAQTITKHSLLIDLSSDELVCLTCVYDKTTDG